MCVCVCVSFSAVYDGGAIAVDTSGGTYGGLEELAGASMQTVNSTDAGLSVELLCQNTTFYANEAGERGGSLYSNTVSLWWWCLGLLTVLRRCRWPVGGGDDGGGDDMPSSARTTFFFLASRFGVVPALFTALFCKRQRYAHVQRVSKTFRGGLPYTHLPFPLPFPSTVTTVRIRVIHGCYCSWFV